MNSVLNHNLFLVKEHLGMFKAANNYDIYNPNTQELLMTCREEKMHFLTKLLRFTEYKKMTPFHIEIRTASGEKILTVRRGITIFVSTVEVLDEKDELIGKFEQSFFSIGGKFELMDAGNTKLCTLQGKWTSWDYKFVKDELVFAQISKKWGGLAKEIFTSADNYILNIDEKVPPNNSLRLLILAAVMCIDMVLKE